MTEIPSRPHARGRVRFLFTGQLIERKGVRTLLDAFEGVPNAELRIAGDGPLAELVRERAASNPAITHLGHLGWEELRQAYLDADVQVLPSLYEVWGLVVNEAAAAGLPVLASDQVAAADHLIVHRRSGFVVEAGNTTEWRAAMCRFTQWDPADFRRSAAISAKLLEGWTIARAADAVLEGAAVAREANPR